MMGPLRLKPVLLRPEAAVAEAETPFRNVRQGPCHVLDGAADGVLAVQGALGSAQHLDPLHVVDVEQRALGAGDVDVVDVQPDAGVHAPQRVRLADAADEGRQRRRLVAALVDRQVGDVALELGDGRRRHVFELVAHDHRDRDRHVLDVLLDLSRGDGDLTGERLPLQSLLDGLFFLGRRSLFRYLGGLLRQGWHCQSQHQGDRSHQQHLFEPTITHDFLLLCLCS